MCPESVGPGVSVSRSQRRAVQSPEPVASREPVGEKEAHRMGAEWPEREEEHRVAGRTRKTAWGVHTTVRVSSVVIPYASFDNTSFSIDLVMFTRVGALAGASFLGGRET